MLSTLKWSKLSPCTTSLTESEQHLSLHPNLAAFPLLRTR